MSDDESANLSDDLPRYRVVTIMWDENAEGPAEVDLGDLNPWVAVSLLATVVDSLRMVLQPPTIKYDGDVIFDTVPEGDDVD